MAVDVMCLRGLSPFADLSENQLEKIAGLCSKLSVYPGQTLFEDGEPAYSIWVSLETEYEVVFTAGGNSLSRIEWLGTGDMLGTLALLPPYRYVSTARGLTEGAFLAINSDGLWKLFQQDSLLAASLLAHMTQAVRKRAANMKSEL